VIYNLKDLLKMIDRVSKKGLYSSKIIQKANMAYLELYTYINWHRNSHRLAHTSQISNMYSISHMADAEIIQFIPVSLVMAGTTSVNHCLNSGRLSTNTVYFA
jgi:hypothetical protein